MRNKMPKRMPLKGMRFGFLLLTVSGYKAVVTVCYLLFITFYLKLLYSSDSAGEVHPNHDELARVHGIG